MGGAALLLGYLCCIGKWPVRFLLQSRKYRGNTSLLHHVYKLKSPGPIRSSSCILKLYYLMANPRHKVDHSLVQLFHHHFWFRPMLLITSLSINFCWDWANHSNPILGTSVTVRTTKRIYWWHLKWLKNDLPSQNLSLQICGGPLNHLLNSISFIKTASTKSTQKHKDQSLSVWSQWLCYRSENLVEADECVHELKKGFTAMTEEALLFWLLKFVDGSLYPPNSAHQICCGLSRALKSANRVDIDMFNSPKFTQFRDTCIKSFFLLWYCYCHFVLMHCCMYRFSKMKLMTQPQVSTWF